MNIFRNFTVFAFFAILLFSSFAFSPLGNAQSELSGDYNANITVKSDPAGHAPFIGQMPNKLTVSISGNTITITGNHPWVAASGTLNQGSFTATGSGTVAGFPNVSVRFVGSIAASGLVGDYTMGANGELPEGQPITYGVQGTKIQTAPTPPPTPTPTPTPTPAYTVAEIYFDKTTYGLNDNVMFQIFTNDDNTDINTVQSIQARIKSTTDPTGLTITLIETSFNTGIFSATISLTNQASAGTKLKVSAGDTITVTYLDQTTPSGAPANVVGTVKVAGTPTPTPTPTPPRTPTGPIYLEEVMFPSIVVTGEQLTVPMTVSYTPSENEVKVQVVVSTRVGGIPLVESKDVQFTIPASRGETSGSKQVSLTTSIAPFNALASYKPDKLFTEVVIELKVYNEARKVFEGVDTIIHKVAVVPISLVQLDYPESVADGEELKIKGKYSYRNPFDKSLNVHTVVSEGVKPVARSIAKISPGEGSNSFELLVPYTLGQSSLKYVLNILLHETEGFHITAQTDIRIAISGAEVIGPGGEILPSVVVPNVSGKGVMKDAIRTTSLSITNTGEQDASIIYLNFPEGSLRWVGMPGWERFRINDNTVVLIADTPLAPNKKADMLFKFDELDIDPETDVDVALPELVGDTVGVETDPVDPFDDELDTFNSSAMPRVIMEEPGFKLPWVPMQLELPHIQIDDLPDLDLDLDCITGEEGSVGTAEAELRGDTVGVGDTEGVILDIDIEVDTPDIKNVGLFIDAVNIDGLLLTDPRLGAKLPADTFPIEFRDLDTELEGEVELEGEADIDDSFIDFIPFLTQGSAKFNDKAEIKMQSDGVRAGTTVSGHALVLVPMGTSCVMSFDAEEEGLPSIPLPFHLGSVLSLPEGKFAIEVDVEPETDTDVAPSDPEPAVGVAEVTLQGDTVGVTVGVTEGVTEGVTVECEIDEIFVDGKALGINPIPLPPNKPVNILEEAGISDIEIDGDLTLTGECTGEATAEAKLQADGVTEGVTEGVAIDVDILELSEFHLDKTLTLPAGDSTVKIKVGPESDGGFVLFDFLGLTVDGGCVLTWMIVDGKPWQFPPIQLPPKIPVNILDEVGTAGLEIEDSLTIDVDCETSGESEARLQGDADGATDVDADVVGVGE